jgi:hypothetical protein
MDPHLTLRNKRPDGVRGGAYNGETYGDNPVRGRAVGEGGSKGASLAWFNDCKRIRINETYAERKLNGDRLSITGSGSSARKAASAAIAEIPFKLAAHIARAFRP